MGYLASAKTGLCFSAPNRPPSRLGAGRHSITKAALEPGLPHPKATFFVPLWLDGLRFFAVFIAWTSMPAERARFASRGRLATHGRNIETKSPARSQERAAKLHTPPVIHVRLAGHL